jgi:hypothetical protein
MLDDARGKFALALGITAALCGCDDNELGWLKARHLGDMTHGPAPRAVFDATRDAACSSGLTTSLGQARMLRQPYLQRVTSERATLMWTGHSEAASVLVWAARDETKREVAAAIDGSAPLPLGRQLVAELGELEPDTIHCYQVVDESGPLTEPTGFRTAPRADARATVQFVALGDLGKGGIDQHAVLEQMRTVPFDLVLMAGDLAYEDGRLEDFENHLFSIYAPVARKVPLMVASGNHDYNTEDAAPFRQAFALFENGGPAGVERWYSFDWGPMHVSVLDSERIGDDQLAWLDADLAATRAPWKVAVTHRPPFSSGKHGCDDDVREHFVPLFEKHGVALVLAGHDHDYERTNVVAGVSYVVTGAGGVGTRSVDSSWFTAFSERVSHFLHVSVSDRVLTMRAIDATGQDFDTLQLQR